jgi:hypothetical protein
MISAMRKGIWPHRQAAEARALLCLVQRQFARRLCGGKFFALPGVSQGRPAIEKSPSAIKTRTTDSEMMCSPEIGLTHEPNSLM